MKKVEPVPTGKDPTLFGVFRNNLPIEIVLQHGGDHPKIKDTKIETPAPRNTRSTFSSLSSLPIWQEEYKS